MSKKPLFLGFNWKLNPTTLEAAQDLLEHYTKLKLEKNLSLGIFPPSIYLHQVSEISVINPSLGFGPQHISNYESGAYTGDLSILQARDLGSDYALIGHSETRQIKGLSNLDINKKVQLTLENGLIPVLCIGYSSQENQFEINYSELQEQLEVGLKETTHCLKAQYGGKSSPKENLNLFKLIIAYEPVWAIGSGKTASKQEIIEVLDFIQGILKKIYSPDIISQIGLLYGGSVDETNCQELVDIPNLNGFLIGGASLKPEKLVKIVNIMNTKA